MRLPLVLALSLSVARAGEPPRPPEGHPPLVLAEGSAVTLTTGATLTVPKGVNIYLDPHAATYAFEVRRYYETRIWVAEEEAQASLWRGILIGVAAGAAAGAALGALARR